MLDQYMETPAQIDASYKFQIPGTDCPFVGSEWEQTQMTRPIAPAILPSAKFVKQQIWRKVMTNEGDKKYTHLTSLNIILNTKYLKNC